MEIFANDINPVQLEQYCKTIFPSDLKQILLNGAAIFVRMIFGRMTFSIITFVRM